MKSNLMKTYFLKTIIILTLILQCITVYSQTKIPKYNLNGRVLDNNTNEPLTGATIVLEGTNLYSISGLDGTFAIRNVPEGEYQMVVSFISYEPHKEELIVPTDTRKDVRLKTLAYNISEVVVTGTRNLSTEASARATERLAINSINAISAKAIELSPDLTVANVVQRMSGLTVERGSSGEPQYAIVRGMEKRYNYTLVNGIKISSPDNENRYVPLDIFPSSLLDQLVVSKSLTPSMEGDAIGGVVDMKLKSAHSRNMLSVNLSSGYSEIFFDRKFDYYNYDAVDQTTPMSRVPEDQIAATEEYFSKDNFNFQRIQPKPNYNGAISLGSRFFNDRLGIIVAATHHSSSRGTDRLEFDISENRETGNLPFISAYQLREYSIKQDRTGIHSKLDYIISPNHSLSFYNVWLNLQTNEMRWLWEDELRDIEEPTLNNEFRTHMNNQRIYNSTLQGEHRLFRGFVADWSLVYSDASQSTPDYSSIYLIANYNTPDRRMRWLLDENQIRTWENNSDIDKAVYYNFTYNPFGNNTGFEIKAGGLYREKNRENNFDLYTFKPRPGVQEYIPYETPYDSLTWRITGGSGTPKHALNYQSYENIFASYIQLMIPWKSHSITGGVRAEHTDQGFSTASDLVVDSNQVYLTFLPSVHLKVGLRENSHIRASYFKALSRPSFLEIIPYRRPGGEDLLTRGGNSYLKPAIAHNFDVRYELFPNLTDQILIGAFFKIINDPIEMAVLPPTDPKFPDYLPQRTTLTTVNFETALNRGIEFDYIKYFNRFGIRGNYTFTLSEVESVKRTWTEVTEDNIHQLTDVQLEYIGLGDSTLLNVTQIRPLQGQSKHLGNLSLLYKDQKRGLDAQISAVYTGERIAVVSTNFETDWWQAPTVKLDFSAEKTIGKYVTISAKVNNLLDTPYRRFIKKPYSPSTRIEHLQPNGTKETLVREEYYGRIFQVGIRFKL
jgi:outer membrane cobalamin receptor